MTGSIVRVARPDSLPPADAKLVVVEASAGTGKTFFLEHRVVDLVLAGVELEQILLVTFTEKAVAELRLRIRDLLDRTARATESTAAEHAWEIDDDARRRLRAAVTAFDHAPIHTIHGFCHRVLVEDAFAAQRMFEQTQIADEVAFDAAFGALLRERFARVSPDRELLAAFLETGRTVDRLRDVLLNCARAGRDARVRRRLAPGAVQEVVRGLREWFGSVQRRQIVEAALAERPDWGPAWIAAIGRALDTLPPETGNELCDAPRVVGMLDSIRPQIELLLKRQNRLPPGALVALRAAESTITLDEAVAAQLLPPLVARIADDKDERGLFDYDDMLQLVWRALTGPRREALAARLRLRTPHVMIDEFQDTDPVQWNIFRTVWMHPGAGLTIVGDPKQAIYSFRGADVRTYIHAREEMLRAGATRVALAVNRRSTPQLVDAVNQILVGNPISPLLDKAIQYDEPVRSAGEVLCEDPHAPITVFQLHSAFHKPPIDQVRLALAGAIGDAIEGLRRAAPVWTTRGTAQPFALGQVMVLARTNRESTEIAAALRARGLPCAVVEPERLFETREASELAAVLTAIAAPRDRAARLRALRTRFFDVPWNELQVVDAPDHHPLMARIFDWAQLGARRAYESLFRKLVDDSHYTERALVLGGGERALTNTWHLIELLLAEVSRSRCDLHELVAQLRRWMADRAPGDDRDLQRVETDDDAIRVLTMHKAKGLEAAYVFVYGGTSGGPKSGVHRLAGDGASRGVTLVLGKPDDVTQQLLDEEAIAENQRLAYVTLTRARVRLYLPMYCTENAVQKNAAYQPIQRCLAPFGGHRPPHAARGLFEVRPIDIDQPLRAPAPPDALAGFVAPPAPIIPLLPELPVAQRGLTMVSYTRLAHDIDIAAVPAAAEGVEIDPAEFDVDDGQPSNAAAVASLEGDAQIVVGPNELPPGASSGLLLHDVLEVAELATAKSAESPEAWAFIPEVRTALTEAACARGVSPRFLPHAAVLAHRMLTAPLALTDGTELPAMADATAVAREVEFSFPIPTVGDHRPSPGLVRGYIDALIAYDDELWVLDYKSDALAGTDLAAAALHRVRQHYEIQARLYAIAADRMRGKRRLGGMLFAFLRYGLVVPMRIEDASSTARERLDAWLDWLARIAERADVAPRVEVA